MYEYCTAGYFGDKDCALVSLANLHSYYDSSFNIRQAKKHIGYNPVYGSNTHSIIDYLYKNFNVITSFTYYYYIDKNHNPNKMAISFLKKYIKHPIMIFNDGHAFCIINQYAINAFGNIDDNPYIAAKQLEVVYLKNYESLIQPYVLNPFHFVVLANLKYDIDFGEVSKL